jgi:transcriptional regulator with XRE-family HTH domain
MHTALNPAIRGGWLRVGRMSMGTGVGEQLREWRLRRRYSQLELSNRAEISTRHLSFIETARSAPSREMLLRLAEHLDVPLRERNHLLLAGGFAPVYSEAAYDSGPLAAVRQALRQLLRAHEPFPAVVIDRWWNLVEANPALGLFTSGLPAELLAPPVNVLRVTLHPLGLAPSVLNLGEWRGHLLGRLARQVAATADPRLAELLAELRAYPCDQPEPEVELPGPGEVLVPLRIRSGKGDLSFLSTVSTFGTPLDVTVSELVIEAFYPADEPTARALGVRV